MSSRPVSMMAPDHNLDNLNSDPATAADPINLLIVDDEPKNLTVLETVLSDPSYRLVRATSAEEALLALIGNEFALLILDIQMPGMTGFELAHMIKKRKRTAQVPIIFLTAYYNEEAHMLEGYDTGAVDYLYKPINPAVLRSKVAVFAELHRKNRECAVANSFLMHEVQHRRRVEEELRDLNQTLEKRVTERTQELQEQASRLRRANEALEQFAFAASHDLQEPLRNIAIYSELLKRRYASALKDEAGMFLETIMEGAHRMTRLISDLLEYTQVDRSEECAAVTDSEKLFSQVLSDLAAAIRESGAAVTHDPLPRVGIKAAHLEQLFQNLIGNALKYKSDHEPPRVHVSAAQRDGQIHFKVCDNGIGIAPEFHTHVFGLFKRLHKDRTEYTGTGLGLAICHRIVERYGGHIWVESEVGKGAAFHFTLPPA